MHICVSILSASAITCFTDPLHPFSHHSISFLGQPQAPLGGPCFETDIAGAFFLLKKRKEFLLTAVAIYALWLWLIADIINGTVQKVKITEMEIELILSSLPCSWHSIIVFHHVTV